MTETIVTPQAVQFIENDQPSLQSGAYTITVSQTLSHSEIGGSDTRFSSTRTFHVEGDQFSLNPQTVYSVFPAASSRGSYTNVLPSIILKRSTLPWERRAALPAWEKCKASEETSENSHNSGAPWLALLLFHEGEVAQPEVVTVGKLSPPPQPSPTQNKEDPVSLLQIPTELLKKLLPSAADLKLLSHVRKGTHEDGSKIELSVVIGNRLPKPGINTVHLVSLEYFFGLKVESETPKKQEEQKQKVDKDNGTFTGIVSLHSWDFVCEVTNAQDHFRNLLTSLDVGTLKLACKDDKDGTVNLYLNKGYVPLKHHLRNFQTTVSWYHSPLLPGKNQQPFSFQFPVRAADQLLVYDREIGLFDSSYAAAWQLGRLMALQDKSLSINLFNWKRQYLQRKIVNRDTLHSADGNKPSGQPTEIDKNSIQLLFQSQRTNTTSGDMPQSILAWFKNLILLDSIPFNYLVPEPGLLPLESLRFFQVDTTWLACVIDGAFGIGDVLTQEADYRECKQKVLSYNIQNLETVTGFLLRSQAIEHYPSLEIKGMDHQKKVLECLRLERLSNNVMICLFSGVVTSITINQKPEALHFGFKADAQHRFVTLREPTTGDFLANATYRKYELEDSHWLDTSLGVLNMVQLSQGMQQAVNSKNPFTALELAVELLEGTCIVQFALENC
ncbi:MAG: hypothetical protein RMY62_016275 [Nostoc sp. ZfuVER08]|nr:hypothetical protein [Nostoc sp. ZfuVER08]